MTTELERLQTPGSTHGSPGLSTLLDMVATSPQPHEVLARVREVLLTVAPLDEDAFDDGRARDALPQWFTDACGPEGDSLSHQDTESPHIPCRSELTPHWDLDIWLFNMRPSERIWSWWDAQVQGPDSLHVVVAATDWPTPLGALEWLLTTAGATQITHL